LRLGPSRPNWGSRQRASTVLILASNPPSRS